MIKATLATLAIFASSLAHDVVLDPFMGSGTTAAVAVQHGRQYVGCELNPDYAPLIEARVAAATPANDNQTASDTANIC